MLRVPALTIETPYAVCGPGRQVFTRERYRDAGERLAAAVCRAVTEAS